MYEFPLIFFRTSVSYRSQVYYLLSFVEAIHIDTYVEEQ